MVPVKRKRNQNPSNNNNLKNNLCNEECQIIKVETKKAKKGKKIKQKNNIFKCDVEDCQTFFEKDEDLKLHLEQHIEQGLHICKSKGCDKHFQEKLSLIKHSKIHKPSNKKYQCTFPGCTKKFTALYNQKVKLSYNINIDTL